jgi:transcriptional regulator with XRE-family HTH domain
MGFYTRTGLIRLAKLIYDDRKSRDLSLREYAALCGLNHSTIARLEMAEFEEPGNELLEKISIPLGLSVVDTILIASGRTKSEEEKLKTADEVCFLLGDLTISELRRLRQMIDQRIRSADLLERTSNFQ